jgi:hypothetical protein
MVSIPAQPGSPEGPAGQGGKSGRASRDRQRGRTRRSRSQPRPRRRGLLVTGLILALAGLAAAAVMVVQQVMPRTFTASQRSQITAWEVGNRWRSWPAAQIFPAGIKYQIPGSAFGGGPGMTLTAHRVGIARQAKCRPATDTPTGKQLSRWGCLAVLRATYDDSTQTLAVTVGVAVLPTAGAAKTATRKMASGHGVHPTVRLVAFKRTPVARFHGQYRQLSWHRVTGPYLVLSAAGFANGRPWLPRGHDSYVQAEILSLAAGVGQKVADSLGAPPPPPHCPGSPAC